MLAAEAAVTGNPDQVMAEQEEVAVEEPVEIEPVHRAQMLPLILAAVAELAPCEASDSAASGAGASSSDGY